MLIGEMCLATCEYRNSGAPPNMDTIGDKTFVLISEVSFFQGENNLYKVGTRSSVLINEGSLFQRCPLREVPL